MEKLSNILEKIEKIKDIRECIFYEFGFIDFLEKKYSDFYCEIAYGFGVYIDEAGVFLSDDCSKPILEIDGENAKIWKEKTQELFETLYKKEIEKANEEWDDWDELD